MGGDISLVSPHGQFLSPLLTLLSGIVLLLVIAWGLLPKKGKKIDMKYTLYVPEMNCKHCKMTIENALNDVANVDEVVVDLNHRTVGINGKANEEVVIQAINQAGYSVKDKKSEQ